jgi:hypothetical protein
MCPPKSEKTRPVMEQLQVLITGVEAGISRDAVRLLAANGACVTAVSGDAEELACFERDVSLYRTQVQAVCVDMADPRALSVFERNLRFFGRLPHIMICCCGKPHGRRRQVEKAKRSACPAGLAIEALQPSLVLHADQPQGSVLGRTLATLRAPTLAALLERAPGRGVFEPAAEAPFVRLGAHLYALRRRFETLPARQPKASPSGRSLVPA